MELYPGDPETSIRRVKSLNRDGWNLSLIQMESHSGTHVDAFIHMVDRGKSLDEIPLERFFGKTVKVKPEESFPNGVNLMFSQYADIEILEKILRSSPGFVCGNISSQLERELLKKEILTFTDLENMEEIPYGEEFLFLGFPLKIKGGDGSPVRALAIFGIV